MKDFQKMLEEVLNEPTLTEVEKHGKLLKSIRTGYESSLNTNGCDWREAYLYLYNSKKYIVIYKCTDIPFTAKECIRFGIMQ